MLQKLYVIVGIWASSFDAPEALLWLSHSLRHVLLFFEKLPCQQLYHPKDELLKAFN
jgi:hypothetical protein